MYCDFYFTIDSLITESAVRQYGRLSQRQLGFLLVLQWRDVGREATPVL